MSKPANVAEPFPKVHSTLRGREGVPCHVQWPQNALSLQLDILMDLPSCACYFLATWDNNDTTVNICPYINGYITREERGNQPLATRDYCYAGE